MNIVSQIKINGEWVNTENVPKEIVDKAVKEAICRGMKRIGFIPVNDSNELKAPEGKRQE